MTWREAHSEIQGGHGTLIGEFMGDDAYRLWWTSEDIPGTSPYPCNFDDTKPVGSEHDAFFGWCCSRFTEAESGVASLVDSDSEDYIKFFMNSESPNRSVTAYRRVPSGTAN